MSDELSLTAIDKALDVCEALSRSPRGVALSELARAVGQPPPTLHRTLAVLKRRGYVRQDDETQRYGLTLKMLDLSFQLLGGSELRLHAYPVLREHVVRSRSPHVSRGARARRGHLRVGRGAGRGRDADGVRPRDAGSLRAVFLAGPGHPATELPEARRRFGGGPSGRAHRAARARWSRGDRSACAARAPRFSTTRAARWRGSACSPIRATIARSIRNSSRRAGSWPGRFRCGSAICRPRS